MLLKSTAGNLIFWGLSALFLSFSCSDQAFCQQSTKQKKPLEVTSASGESDQNAEANEAKNKGKKQASDEEKKDDKKLPGVRQINLGGLYLDLVEPTRVSPSRLIWGAGPKKKSFFKLLDFIDDLATDDDFDYVVFDLSKPIGMNPAQLDQLERHLKKLSESKKTFAWIESVNRTGMAIAACCDKVYQADFGMVNFSSQAIQQLFYGDALDLLGMEFSVARAGNFKGAVEPYVNQKMSKHLREHYLGMLTSLNDTSVERVARSRGLKKSDVRDLQKTGLFTPSEAVEVGLVDKIAPYGSMRETIENVIKKEVNWITPKSAEKKNVSFMQLMGKLVGDSSGSKRFKKNSIAVVHLQGSIVSGSKPSAGSIVSGPTVKMIDKLIAEDRVKGVVVRLNTPGGSAQASEAIRQSLLKLVDAKPTVISMGSMAASGGYWISCIGTPIYAERGTITGSIGVFAMKPSYGALMRRFGVHAESIALDEAALSHAVDRAWTEQDAARVQKNIDLIYDRFLGLVSEHRGLSLDTLKDLAGGRVWTGAQGIQNGLVDHLGGVDDCIKLVAKKANLDGDYSIAHRPLTKTGFDIGSLIGSEEEEEIFSGIPKTAIRLLENAGIDLSLTRLLVRDAINNKRATPTVWALLPFEMSIH